jgi:RNA polymerase sigma factor (sigma-70 family)
VPAPQAPPDFAELVRAHERAVLAYALRRTRTSADAEDVAAETWAIAWRRRETLPVDTLPWLFATARRVLANQHRGGRRRLALLERLRGRAPEMAAETRLGEPEGPVTRALERLRPDDAELLRLVAWEELDHARIAAVLGISPNAVAVRLHRARARFAATYAGVDGAMKDGEAERTYGSLKATLAGTTERVE